MIRHDTIENGEAYSLERLRAVIRDEMSPLARVRAEQFVDGTTGGITKWPLASFSRQRCFRPMRVWTLFDPAVAASVPTFRTPGTGKLRRAVCRDGQAVAGDYVRIWCENTAGVFQRDLVFTEAPPFEIVAWPYTTGAFTMSDVVNDGEVLKCSVTNAAQARLGGPYNLVIDLEFAIDFRTS